MIKLYITERVINRVIKYAPEIRKSLEFRLNADIEHHSSELFHLRGSFFGKGVFHQNFANDAFFLFAHEYLSQNEIPQLPPAQADQLATALEDLDTMDRYFALMDELQILVNAFKSLQIQNHVETALSSVMSQKNFMGSDKYSQLTSLVQEFERVMAEMEDHPEWQAKLSSACNKYIKWFYIFHTNLDPTLQITPHFNRNQNFM